MNAYSQDLRGRAINLYLTGNYTKRSISELLSIGYKTLRKWITIYEMTGSCKLIKIDELQLKAETKVFWDYVLAITAQSNTLGYQLNGTDVDDFLRIQTEVEPREPIENMVKIYNKKTLQIYQMGNSYQVCE